MRMISVGNSAPLKLSAIVALPRRVPSQEESIPQSGSNEKCDRTLMRPVLVVAFGFLRFVIRT